MKSKLYDTLKVLLLKVDEFKTQDGGLNYPEIQRHGYNATPQLIKVLHSNADLKQYFFIQQGDLTIYNRDLFMEFISNKKFLANSYTRYSNKIGLNIDNKFLKSNTDVVLNFPFKDCVLEGGQTKENRKQNELFFNEVLAHDEIDQLLSPKVLTNAKRINAEGEKPTTEFKRDEKGTIKDNLIIKGNNLIALHSIKKQFSGKVKLIYIDPPYNTGSDDFKYNDKFTHSTWLTFMKNRLEAARELLLDNGVIFVQCDDNEQAYLKVLMDEIFGRENFVNNLIWHKKNVVQNDAKYFNENHDHILVFCKNKTVWKPNLLERTEEMNMRYKNPDNDPRGLWTSVALQAKSGNENNIYEIEFPNGVKWKPVEGTYPRLKKESLMDAYREGRLSFGSDGKSVPRLKKYLNEVQQGRIADTIFSNGISGSTQQGKEELKKVLNQNIFATPKPEKLIKRIIDISTEKNDIVLDYHLGSGTTCAVAHKMGRQYIGIEQMDYIENIAVERMKKVIAGEQGGVSKSLEWKGGGDLVYMEMKSNTADIVQKIADCKNKKELAIIKNNLDATSIFIDYRLNLDFFHKEDKDFDALSLDEQKSILISIFDKNQLYVSYSERNDAMFSVSDKEKTLSKNFYGKK